MANRDYLTLGSSPTEEDCVQINEINYYEKSRKECNAYIRQIIRTHGDPPDQTSIVIQSCVHEFGTYHEVICSYDNDIQESVEYALHVEANLPEKWDAKSLKELGLPMGNRFKTAVGD
jgi:hypothetical protein